MTAVATKIADVRKAVAEVRRNGIPVGLAPTMGALHAGHASLIRAAHAECGFVVVSIFVNPTQFGVGEDYEQYPRPLEADVQICRDEDVDLVFAPEVAEMYPDGVATTVHVDGLTEKMCGAGRPGHFDGVCTIIAKLLGIVEPDTAYFGEKDAQQLAVIRRMVRDRNLGVDIQGCPLVRDPDGLATSSRNAYLSADQRAGALVLSRAIGEARERIEAGEHDAATLAEIVRQRVGKESRVALEYVAVVDPDTLEDLAQIKKQVLIALAAKVGSTRLIDNVLIRNLKA